MTDRVLKDGSGTMILQLKKHGQRWVVYQDGQRTTSDPRLMVLLEAARLFCLETAINTGRPATLRLVREDGSVTEIVWTREEARLALTCGKGSPDSLDYLVQVDSVVRKQWGNDVRRN
jgi:hypothetical protein